MSRLQSIASSFFVCACVLLAFPPPAYAYLDPGTGSLIVQLLVAGLLGVALTIRLFWRRIRAGVALLFRREKLPRVDRESHDH
ncbi:MAG: hypothetical protein K6V36_07215 [Anaerolineae bacterium]|nr:hypothetical protein [Anaerolineae bacterium]